MQIARSSRAPLLEEEPRSSAAAAVRWHGRYCFETRAGTEEAQAVLLRLGATEARASGAAGAALANLIHRRGLERGSEAVMRWSQA